MRTRPKLRLVLTGLLLALASGQTADAQAAEFGGNCLIQTTPFYNRLVDAGVLKAPMTALEDRRAGILLFKMARTFHYSSDAKKRDRWQSAEQTSLYFRGDCEDKAIWLYTQMRRSGYDNVSLHIGKYAPSSRKFHMWVTHVDEDGYTLLLDPTIQRKPWPVTAFPEQNYRSLHIITGDDCVSL